MRSLQLPKLDVLNTVCDNWRKRWTGPATQHNRQNNVYECFHLQLLAYG